MQSANPQKDGVHYRVWAPLHNTLSVDVNGAREVELRRDEDGVFTGVDAQGKAGDLYQFKLPDGKMLPDPGAHFQPQGVHGPSEVIDHSAFQWPATLFKTPTVRHFTIYDNHIGTSTKEVTLTDPNAKLNYLKEQGVTAIQIMPVADFG